MNFKKTIIVLAALFLGASATNPACATGMIAGATFPEQIVQELTLVEQYAQQAQQLQAQFQMVYNQARNLEGIPSQMWPNVSAPLQNLVQLVGNAQGLNYAAQNTVAAVQQQYGTPNAPLSNYSQSLQQWTDNQDHQTAAVLQQYGLHAADFQTTQAALQSIETASQTASGRMQVLQAGNQISGLMVNQLQSLQSDIQAGNQVLMNQALSDQNDKQQQQNDEIQLLSNPMPSNW